MQRNDEDVGGKALGGSTQMTFTESNTVEQMILDAVAKHGRAGPSVLSEDAPSYGRTIGTELHPTRMEILKS
jgi:hypothetical protein